MSAGIYTLPVSVYRDNTMDGVFANTPATTFAHNTSSHTLQVYFGGFSTNNIASAKIYFESLDGTVTDNHALTLNSDTTSGTYTSTNTDAWLAAANVTFKIWVVVTPTATDVNLNFPNGNVRTLISAKVLEVSTT